LIEFGDADGDQVDEVRHRPKNAWVFGAVEGVSALRATPLDGEQFGITQDLQVVRDCGLRQFELRCDLPDVTRFAGARNRDTMMACLHSSASAVSNG
jgi:hypothetical protein